MILTSCWYSNRSNQITICHYFTCSLTCTYIWCWRYHVGDINSLPSHSCYLLIVTFLTAGTMIGLATQAGFMKNNEMPRTCALMADGYMTVGAVIGTSPTSAYVESSSGI